jgi:hypothetical protein
MYALRYREEIKDPGAIKELDDLVAYFNHFLGQSLDEKGNILPAALTPVDLTAPVTGVTDDEQHHWKNGPWIFDTPSAHNAIIVTPQLQGTINNMAPGGIDTAVGVEFNLSADLTITGIKAPVGAYRRILILRNNSGAHTITLKHANTGSQSVNRFQLPGSADIVMSTRQTVWLYYDADNHNWGCFITANTSGGLSGAGGPSTGDVFGPAGATNGHVALFDGATGKLIKDGGAPATGDVVGPGSAVDGDIVLFDGTGGKLVKDSGVTLASITAVTGVSALSGTLSISDANIKALNSTPLTLVNAVASKIIMPIMLTMEKGPWTNAYSANPSVSLRWAGIAADLVSSFGSSFGGTGFAGATGMNNSPSWTSTGVNKALQLRSTADITSVGDTTGNTAVFRFVYYII